MKKIFIEENINDFNSKVRITGKDYNHLSNSLRVSIGEEFVVGDASYNEYLGVISEINKKEILIEIKNQIDRKRNDIDVTMFFSVLKGDKNEDIIRKCSEIGVNTFIPTITNNTIVEMSDKNGANKLLRWRALARETSLQCGRKRIPEIFPIIYFDDINKYAINSLKIFGEIESEKSLKSVFKENVQASQFACFSGPEGDFTKNEIASLKSMGWIGINLGDNILRSETSAIFVASSIFFFYPGGV